MMEFQRIHCLIQLNLRARYQEKLFLWVKQETKDIISNAGKSSKRKYENKGEHLALNAYPHLF